MIIIVALGAASVSATLACTGAWLMLSRDHKLSSITTRRDDWLQAVEDLRMAQATQACVEASDDIPGEMAAAARIDLQRSQNHFDEVDWRYNVDNTAQPRYYTSN